MVIIHNIREIINFIVTYKTLIIYIVEERILMDTVNIIFKYTQDEYVKAARVYLIASKIIRRFDIVLLAIFIPFSIIYFFLSHYSVLSIIILMLIILVSIIGFMAYFYIPVRNFRLTSKFHEEYRLTFSQDGISFKTPTIDSEIKWDVYSKAWESRDYYYLIQAPQMYMVVPKRAFNSDVEINSFEKIILSVLGDIKKTA